MAQAQLYGISGDAPQSHQAWHDHLHLPKEITFLSDFNREFGPLYELSFTNPAGMQGVLRRAVFVIRPDGTIAYRWDNTEPPSLPKVEDIAAALRAL